MITQLWVLVNFLLHQALLPAWKIIQHSNMFIVKLIIDCGHTDTLYSLLKLSTIPYISYLYNNSRLQLKVYSFICVCFKHLANFPALTFLVLILPIFDWFINTSKAGLNVVWPKEGGAYMWRCLSTQLNLNLVWNEIKKNFLLE
jgi:hypothetical protein